MHALIIVEGHKGHLNCSLQNQGINTVFCFSDKKYAFRKKTFLQQQQQLCYLHNSL